MSYRLSHLGEAAVAAESTRAPSPSQQAVAVLGLTAMPWIPVIGLAWAGKKWKGNDGLWIGAASGLALSFFTLRHVAKQMSGANV